MWGNSSWPLPLWHGVLLTPAPTSDARRLMSATQLRGAAPRTSSGVAGGSHPAPEARGSNQDEQPHIQGMVAAWAQKGLEELSTLKVRKGSGEEIPFVQAKEQWLHFAVAAVNRYPMTKILTINIDGSLRSQSKGGNGAVLEAAAATQAPDVLTGAAKRRYPMSKFRSSGCEEIPNVQVFLLDSKLIETSDSKFIDRPAVKGTWKTAIYKTNYSIMQEEPSYVEGQEGWREEMALIQGKEQRLYFAGVAVKRYPMPRLTGAPVQLLGYLMWSPVNYDSENASALVKRHV
ncbi:hypothetical protein MG293_001762 [Ovis ammon polii]|uniref:Uncharacterized protein n=1 Tax=Ovis ammon polii TaxID=230172 RepID=A0AAD4YJ25_OVIAM|nr:hypothetical protein MG293_001762 [Ovis ammon polii]